MKNTSVLLLLLLALFSCEKNAITETISSVKSADSLLTNARKQISTLDSLRKTITDSDGVAARVIIPELGRQKKKLDSAIKSGAFSADSLNKQLKKVSKNVKTGTSMAKTLDSATAAIDKGGDPLDVLAQAADKILKQSKENTSQETPQNSLPPNSPKEQLRGQPISKKAQFEIEVEDLSTASALLQQEIRNNDAHLTKQNLSTTENIQQEDFEITIPLENFEKFTASIASDLGEVRLKNIEREGTEEIPFRTGNISISLVHHGKPVALTTLDQVKNSENAPQDSGLLKNIATSVLSFWPLILILLGLLFWMIRRKKQQSVPMKTPAINPEKNKDSEESAKITETEKVEPIPSEEEEEEEEEDSEPDYSKYMPKK